MTKLLLLHVLVCHGLTWRCLTKRANFGSVSVGIYRGRGKMWMEGTDLEHPPPADHPAPARASADYAGL